MSIALVGKTFQNTVLQSINEPSYERKWMIDRTITFEQDKATHEGRA